MLATFGAVALAAATLVLRGSTSTAEMRASSRAAKPTETGATTTTQAVTSSRDVLPQAETEARALATISWGSGSTEIKLPDEDEAHGETPLKLAATNAGVFLLDNENQRVVRLKSDGSRHAPLRLRVKDPRDIAVAKDGSLLLLHADGGGVSVLSASGDARATLPVPQALAEKSRGVVVQGRDVYVESHRGALTRIGDVSGLADPSPAEIPGQPTRDGRGYLTARIANPRTGMVHVYVVERPSLAERFSRVLRTRTFVEGIFLVDTSESGTIYVGVTGAKNAELLCLEPERGDVIGSVDLPVRLDKEAILDADAQDGGGIVYSVSTEHGLRVARADCP